MSGSRPGPVRLAARALRRARLVRPRICFLVAGGDGADLDATLDALRGLRRADVVFLAAATPGTADSQVVAAHARADWRVRPVIVSEWSAAARAAARVRSRHVAVMRAGDLPRAGAIAAAEATLRTTRSGLAVGSGLRLADPSSAVFGWRTWQDVLGAGSPELLLASALTRVPDAVRLTDALVERVPPSPVRGMVDTRPHLAGWLDRESTVADLFGPGSPIHAAWAVSVLAGEAQRFLEDAERYGEQQWSALHQRVVALADAAGEDGLSRIPVEGRVRVALAAAGRRADLVRFVAARRFEGGQYPTTAADGTAYAVLPVPDDLPTRIRRLSAAETALRTSVRRLRWVGDELEMEVFACVAAVDLLQHRPTVTARLVGHERTVELDVELGSDREVTRWMGTHHVNHDHGVLRLRVPVAELAIIGRQTLEVTVAVAGFTRSGVVTEHDPGGSAALLRPRTYAGATVSAELEPGFALVARPADGDGDREPGSGVVDDVAVTDGRLVVHGRDLSGLVLRGPHGTVAGEAHDGAMTWSLSHDPWGLGRRPLPPGRYLLTVRATDGFAISGPLADRLPETVLTGDHRVVVRREPHGTGHDVALVLGPPLADDEVGAYCQRRLQDWYADPAHELDDHAVYLQAYTGQNATDSPLAVAEELARSRPDLSPTWAVSDGGSRVPAGSATVLWRSRAWYAALARSRYVVTNIELESWFRRRPGQQVLQTFHGYPSKAMGLGLWRQKNFTASRIEQQLDRTARNWSLLLTPAPEMDEHYRENYRYDGPILASGYPRDDVLVSPAALAVRAATRDRLGIPDEVTVVLYAPTWRDDQATNFRAARMVDHLDVAAAAEALGPGFVLLLRGHRFMSATGPSAGSRVVDVTTYPEVNDLILAADAAVLDYSSMRFDFALTGRPMVFLVPDLEEYATTKRGFLFDFEPTAPGPLARTSDEVIAALRDLDGVRERHREDYERFNATYNRLQDGAAAQRVVAHFFRR